MDPSSTESGKNNKFLQRAYALSGIGEAQDLYNEWATSYDNDLNGQEYASPQRAVEAVLRSLGEQKQDITILDAGCGTGFVGKCFAESKLRGHFMIDGNDLTQGMLDVARNKGVYRDLKVADLNKSIETDHRYDVVTCVGTLTKGHVGPKVFREFAKVTAPGGLIVATVHNEIWQSGGYESEIIQLSDEGIVDVISTNEFGILKSSSQGGRMVVLRKK